MRDRRSRGRARVAAVHRSERLWSRWCSSACRSRASRCSSDSCHTLKPLAVMRVRPNCCAVSCVPAKSPRRSPRCKRRIDPEIVRCAQQHQWSPRLEQVVATFGKCLLGVRCVHDADNLPIPTHGVVILGRRGYRGGREGRMSSRGSSSAP